MEDENTVPFKTRESQHRLLPEEELGLPERFVVEETLGGGGMGLVVRAFDSDLQKSVAIKILNDDLTGEPDQIQRFLREAKTLGQLEDPHILQIKSFGVTASGRPYQVMELLSGENLSERLKEGPLSLAEFKDIFMQLIDALSYAASKGVVHRDIKPSNIFLTTDANNKLTVKLVDFGIARLETASGETTKNLTKTNIVLGSPPYMSPEQCRGAKVDFLSDIYSLGCVMYECLEGKPPFMGETPLETMYLHMTAPPPEIKATGTTLKELAQLIAACLNKSPAERASSYEDLSKKVESVLQCPDTTVLINEEPQRKRRLQQMVLIAAAAAIVIPLLATATFHVPKKTRQPELTPLQKKLAEKRQALTKFEQSLSANPGPGETDTLYNMNKDLGDAFLQSKGFLQAAKCYQKCADLTRSPRDKGTSLMLLGDALLHSKVASHRVEALDVLEQAKTLLDPLKIDDNEKRMLLLRDRIHARILKAVTFAALGNMNEAHKEDLSVAPLIKEMEEISLRDETFLNYLKADHAYDDFMEFKNCANPVTSEDRALLADIFLRQTEYLLQHSPESQRVLVAFNTADALLNQANDGKSCSYAQVRAYADRLKPFVRNKTFGRGWEAAP